jgi:hypothetical protein
LQRAVIIIALIAAGLASAQTSTESATVAQPAGGTSPITEGSTPAAAATTTLGEAPEKEEKLHFLGFDLSVSLADNSGLYFHSESYYNVLSLQLDPSFALGRMVAGKDSWWAPLTLSLRLPIDFELSSSEPAFRGSTFTSTQLYNNPESIPVAEAAAPEAGQIDGLTRRPVRVSDLTLQISHARLVKIPGVGLEVGGNFRLVAPISTLSRNQGLITAPSLGLSIGRELGPFEFGYSGRFTKYFFTRNQPAIVGTQNTVEVNGKLEETWRPASTGVTNPDYGFVQGLELALHLPKGFGLSASYFLFHTKPLPLSGCDAAGVAGSNVCTDGALVGPVVPNQWRHEQAFAASIDYDPGPLTVSLGLATLRGLWASDGKVAQPFVFINAYNYTTVSLTLASSPETIANFLEKK